MQLDPDATTVLRLSATGLTPPEVAAALGRDPALVRQQLRRAIAALGAASKLEAVVLALRAGLIDLPASASERAPARPSCVRSRDRAAGAPPVARYAGSPGARLPEPGRDVI